MGKFHKSITNHRPTNLSSSSSVFRNNVKTKPLLLNPKNIRKTEKTCARCMGRGYYKTLSTRNCARCNGTGRNLQSRLGALPCSNCRNGSIATEAMVKCGSCNGKGIQTIIF